MTRKTINVTRNDIWHGRPRDAHGCPISLSLRRLFPQKTVSVYNSDCSVGSYKALLPMEAIDFGCFIDRFPLLRFFCRPFSFSLEFHDMDMEKAELDYYYK